MQEDKNLKYVWELVNEIINKEWTFSDVRDCFGIDVNGKTGFQIVKEIFSNNPKDVKEKFEKWKKEREEVHVGDIVTVDDGDAIFLCTKDNANGNFTKCHLLGVDGSVWESCPKRA